METMGQFFARRINGLQNHKEAVREVLGMDGTVLNTKPTETGFTSDVFTRPSMAGTLRKAGFTVEVTEQWNEGEEEDVCRALVSK